MTIVTSTTIRRFRRPGLGRTAARSMALTAAVLGLLLASSMPAAAKAPCPPGQGSNSSSSRGHGSFGGFGGESGSSGSDGAAGRDGSSSFGGFGSNGIGGHGGSGLGGLGSNGLNGLGGIDINSLTQGAGNIGNIGATVGIGNLSVTAGEFGKHDCEGITEHVKDVWRFAASAGSILSIDAKFSDANGGIHNVTTGGSGSANASVDSGNASASASASVAISPDIAGLKLIGGSGVVKGVGAGVKVNLNLISTCPAKTSEQKPGATVKTNTAQPSSVAVAAKQAMLPTTGSALTWYLVTAAAMLAIGMAFVLAVRRRRAGQQVV